VSTTGLALHSLRTDTWRSCGVYVWECTSVSEKLDGSCSNCHSRTYTGPVITNIRHDMYSGSIYHSRTWSPGQPQSHGISKGVNITSVWNLLSNVITSDDSQNRSFTGSCQKRSTNRSTFHEVSHKRTLATACGMQKYSFQHSFCESVHFENR
jgi:hypothetical protein